MKKNYLFKLAFVLILGISVTFLNAKVAAFLAYEGSAYPDGTPHVVPGTIEAENFDNGGLGVAYNDNEGLENGSNPYRPDVDVEIENCSNGENNYNIGYTSNGEWLKYTFEVTSAGKYIINSWCATENSGSFHLLIDDVEVTDEITVATGGWQAWEPFSSVVDLTAGIHVLTWVTTGNMNLDKFVFESGEPDLVVTKITWSPVDPKEGDEVIFTATVKNQGQADTYPVDNNWKHGVAFSVNGSVVSWSDFYDEEGQIIKAGEEVDLVAVGGPFGNAYWMCGEAEEYIVTAHVNDTKNIFESNYDNNKLDATLIPNGEADLIITDITWTPAIPNIGDEVIFTAIVKNQGTAPTKPVDNNWKHGVAFSVNGSVVSWSDFYNEEGQVIAPGEEVALVAVGGPNSNNAFWICGPDEVYTVKAEVNDTKNIFESDYTNNIFEKEMEGEADLVVTDITWTPEYPVTGDEVTFTAIVKNQGRATTQPVDNNWKHGVAFSVNGSVVNWSDFYDEEGQAIAPGEEVELYAVGGPSGNPFYTVTGEGTNFVYNISAHVNDTKNIFESNYENNTLTKQLGINGEADLIIADITWEPVNPISGDDVVFTAIVKNQGFAPTKPVDNNWKHGVAFSVNGSVVNWSDFYDEEDQIIEAGEEVALYSVGGPSGNAFYTIAGEDANLLFTVKGEVNDTKNIVESDYTNNIFETEMVANAAPDLIITDITWEPVNPVSGDEVIFTAIVKNQGYADTYPIDNNWKHGVAFSVNNSVVSWSDFYDEEGQIIRAGEEVALVAVGGPSGNAYWVFGDESEYNVTGHVNDTKNIFESDYDNNTLTLLIIRTGIKNIDSDDPGKVYIENGQLCVAGYPTGSLEVYNMMGQRIDSYNTISDVTRINLTTSGVYVIRVLYQGKTYSSKVLVK